MANAIEVTDLSKAYQLGDFGTGTISRDIERYLAKLRGKEDPFLRIGETNDRSSKGNSDVVWSLKNLDFAIEQGSTIGIIGRNGAGKSTLLKILSRVTSPTIGMIKVRGRIASLLEVGTGFHPELTGRENIFLNGAIMGMRKAEIKRKFDEIIAFSGVERYIDTPVKRYSSGMYVRLAFAVAAHLESDIMVVDEVLAVGDAEFQKKCLGKMDSVSKNEGRTVLFVSHNMSAISSLCERSLLLENGMLKMFQNTKEVINNFMAQNDMLTSSRSWEIAIAPGNEVVRLLGVRTVDRDRVPNSDFDVTDQVGIELKYEVLQTGHILWHGLNLYNDAGINIFDTHNITSPWYYTPHPAGIYTTTAWIPGNLLNEGRIILNAAIFNHTVHQIHLHVKEVVAFQVIDNFKEGIRSSRGSSTGKFDGVIRPLLLWDHSVK